MLIIIVLLVYCLCPNRERIRDLVWRKSPQKWFENFSFIIANKKFFFRYLHLICPSISLIQSLEWAAEKTSLKEKQPDTQAMESESFDETTDEQRYERVGESKQIGEGTEIQSA